MTTRAGTVQFRMERKVDPSAPVSPQATSMPASFDYWLEMLPDTGGAAITIISGTFAASGMARTGRGALHVTLADAHAAGIVLNGLEKLVTLDITYDTVTWPRSLMMHIENLPDDPTMDASSADYTYERADNGDGAMTFAWTQDAVPGPLGPETLMIESRWQASGVGRYDASVEQGDLAGSATVTECWDTTFASTYRLESWAPPETGDEATCLPRL